MDNRYNRHNRWKYSLKVHIVLVTKYRKQLLKDSIADDVKQKIFDIANTYGYEIIGNRQIWFRFFTSKYCKIVKQEKRIILAQIWFRNRLEEKNILVRRIFCLQHWRSIVNYHTKNILRIRVND